jgi:hypothetical protein
VELAIHIQGVNELVRNLTDLGTKKIPVFVALSLTTIADKVQDALIAHTRLRLTVRGRWLVKGYKYGINRYRATKHNLAAEVWTQAPWLIEQEAGEPISPEKGTHLAVPLAILRASRLDPRKIPRRLRPAALKRAFKIRTQSGKEIIYRRKGKGKRSTIEPLYHLERETKIPKRLALVETAMHAIDRHAPGAMDYALSQAIKEASLSK